MPEERLEHSYKLNGYAIRSWGDLVAIATLLAMLVASVAWGIKLEINISELEHDLISIHKQVGTGILPRAEERIGVLQERQRQIQRTIDEHKIDDPPKWLVDKVTELERRINSK